MPSLKQTRPPEVREDLGIRIAYVESPTDEGVETCIVSILSIREDETGYLSWNNKNVTSKTTEFISKLPNVRKINLPQSIYLTSSDFKAILLTQMSYLHEIYIPRSNITDNPDELVWKCVHLEVLSAYFTQLDDRFFEGFNPSFPIKIMNLDGTEITDETVRIISQCNSLWSLAIAGTKVTNTALEYLPALKNLRFIELGSTQVTREAIHELKKKMPNTRFGMTSLKKLYD